MYCSIAKLCPTLCDPINCSTPGFPSFTISRGLLGLTSTESVLPPSHPILCRPLLLLPSIFPSIRAFPSELALHIRWPKDWSFSFSVSPSNKYSRLISFRVGSFDLLAVQETQLGALITALAPGNPHETLTLDVKHPESLRKAWTWNQDGARILQNKPVESQVPLLFLASGILY